MKKLSFFFAGFCFVSELPAQNMGIGTTTPTGPLTVIANDTAKGISQKKGNVEIGFRTNTTAAYVQTCSQRT